MSIFYVISGIGNDNNSGSTSGSLPKVSGINAACTSGSPTINLASGTPDLSLVVSGDTIRLSGRTDGQNISNPSDIFAITSIDNILKTANVVPSPNSNGSGITWAIGGAFATMTRSANVATSGDHIYINGTFNESVDMASGCRSNSLSFPITYEGYSITPGDSGMAVFDSNNTKINGISIETSSSSTLFYIFKNIRATRYTGRGWKHLNASYPVLFINCRADNCGSDGFKNSAINTCVHCYSHDNGGNGFDFHDHAALFGCIADRNVEGIVSDAGPFVQNCLLRGNTSRGVHVTNDFTKEKTTIINTIIDGSGVTDIGVDAYSSTYQGNTYLINSTIINCGTGITVFEDHGLFNQAWGNVFYGNQVNYVNYSTELEVNNPPLFVSSGIDYTPLSGSSVIGSGYDIRQNQWSIVTGQQAVIGGILPIENFIDYPSQDNVRLGVIYNSGSNSGNLELPLINDVKNGVQYGSNGNEFTGTYVGSTIILEGDNMALVEYDYSLDEPISVIGDFDTGRTVNIELWVDGVAQPVTSSGCDEINGTGKYAWPTSNISVLVASRVQYHWRMTDDLSNVVEGDFVLKAIEGNDGFMPSLNNKDSYIIKL